MTAGLPEWAYAAALAGLPYMVWDRLSALIAEAGDDAQRAWERVLGGAAAASWSGADAAVSVEAVAAAHVAAGVTVHLHGCPGRRDTS
ncbi:MAG TPA: hypothetical protein VNA57_02120 [Acidimicrobiales bacterium]|nr:hypothetical protein [Acidimicrobiales bacterium]